MVNDDQINSIIDGVDQFDENSIEPIYFKPRTLNQEYVAAVRYDNAAWVDRQHAYAITHDIEMGQRRARNTRRGVIRDLGCCGACALIVAGLGWCLRNADVLLISWKGWFH